MAKTWDAVKDPDEIRDFGIDWSADLGALTISTSVWTVIEGTVVINSNIHDATSTTIRLSGGTLGETCLLTNHVSLSDGQQLEQSGKLKIRAK